MKIPKWLEDRDFGGVSIPRLVMIGFVIFGAAFLIAALTGNLKRCWEETGPHGHIFTVCDDGKYNTFREHSPECPVVGCPYGMEVQP